MSVYDSTSPYILSSDIKLKDLDNVIKTALPLSNPEVDRAFPIKGSAEDGFLEIYHNSAVPGSVKKALHPALNTYGKFFDFRVLTSPNSPCFAYRKYDYVNKSLENAYTDITYAEVGQRKKNFGAGLMYLLANLPYKKPDTIESHALIDNHEQFHGQCKFNQDFLSFILTIYAPNRYEWILTDLMCQDYSITNTSLYDTLGPDVSKYILELTQSPVIVLDHHNIDTVLNLKKAYPEELKSIILMISMDPLDLEGNNSLNSFEDTLYVKRAAELGCTLIDLDRVEKLGALFPRKTIPSTPELVYTISFTSGTTGSRPKGVILTNVAATSGTTFLFAKLKPPKNGRTFSFLPLAHIFERQGLAFSVLYGGVIGFPQRGGTPLTLVEDMKLFKPVHMSNVPRVLTKFEAAIKANTIENKSLALTRNIFGKIIETKMELQLRADGDPGSHFIYDNTLLKKIRTGFGLENAVFMITGSAPIAISTLKFLKASLNIGFGQGYGLTETFAGFCISELYEVNPGTCGATGVTTEIKIRELPDLGYRLTDKGGPRGELLIRGFNNFASYYKNDEETNKAVIDGWFYSGDVAQIDECGRISIIDRVKNFFKLAQGEYITPEKIENLYLSLNPFLSQLFIHGDLTQSYLVGIAGVDPIIGRQFLLSQGVLRDEIDSDKKFLEVLNQKKHREAIIGELYGQVTKGFKLQGFEKLKNVYFEIEPLTLQRDVVTPTLKLKRPIAGKFFKEQIAAMYKEGPLDSGSSKL